MSAFGCLLTALFGIVIFAFVLLRGIINTVLTLLGLRPPTTEQSQQFRTGNPFGQQHSRQQGPQQARQNAQNHGKSQRSAGQQKAKIFERDANEYVDFEEV